MPNRVTERDAQLCQELATRFASDDELWQRYRDLVNRLKGIDVDAEFVSRPVRDYIKFVSNDIRDWFLQNSPDLESDKASFDYFHRLIETDAAK